MRGDGWEDYLEGRERMDLIKTAQPLWMNLNVSDTARLDELFDHTGFGDAEAFPLHPPMIT